MAFDQGELRKALNCSSHAFLQQIQGGPQISISKKSAGLPESAGKLNTRGWGAFQSVRNSGLNRGRMSPCARVSGGVEAAGFIALQDARAP